MNQYNDDSLDVLDSLPWQEILEMAKSKHFEGKFESIPEETLKFILDDNNQAIVTHSVLKSLQSSDSENANLEYAEEITQIMKEFAQRVLRERMTN